MYLSKEYVLAAIGKLGEMHPFFGITFLACKRLELPVNDEIKFPMDKNTREFMESVHRLNPTSQYFYQPYNSNARDKFWITSKYPSAGLQAINTQTFRSAFSHNSEKTWAWSENYIFELAKHLKKGKKLPALALSIWVHKAKKWPESTTLPQIIEYFFTSFHISDAEKKALFSVDISGYPVAPPFQDIPVTWQDLKAFLTPPPDATPSRGATLSFLKLDNVGPTSSMTLEPKQRLNIITGDNGLGKSFLMECAWWALTGTWPDIAAQSQSFAYKGKPTITYELASEKGASIKFTTNLDTKSGVWSRNTKAPSIPGLIVYARVDGSYAVWDPIKQYSQMGNQQRYVFSKSEIWDGIPGSIEGLMRDWVKWQSTPEKYPFDTLVSVLRRMSPPDLGDLQPGQPIRMLNDIRDIPTIVHPYGEIPILNASAGVRRIITLVYLIVWAWHEHRVGAELTKSKPEKRMVIIIDEIEAHLHPKWQRAILPALLDIQSLLSSELEIQFIISTHSPLVLASAETFFSSSTDGLFHLTANDRSGEAELANIDFIKYGQVNSWLTSPIFDLGQARAQSAEFAINQAKALQLKKTPTKEEVVETHRLLLDQLAETDPFWPRWLYFAEKNGVII